MSPTNRNVYNKINRVRGWESREDGSRAEERILRGIFHHKDTLESPTQSPPKVNLLASTSHSSPPRSYRENCPEAIRGRNAFTFLNKGLRPPLAKWTYRRAT